MATATTVENDQLTADKAVDGSLSTRWASEEKDDERLGVDLGAVYLLDEVSVNWEVAYAAEYDINVATDTGDPWTTVVSVSNDTAGMKTTAFNPIDARYVQIHCKTRGTQWGFSIWELMVFGEEGDEPPPDPPDIDEYRAPAKTALRSLIVDGYSPPGSRNRGNGLDLTWQQIKRGTHPDAPESDEVWKAFKALGGR